MRYNTFMPATAQPQAKTDPAITYTDDQLTGLQKSVASNLQKAGVRVPLGEVASSAYEAVKPIHVPDATPVNIVDLEKINTEKSVPASFNSTPETAFSPLKALSEHLDYADQIVTGRTHITDEAHRFSALKDEKEQKRMIQANAPKTDVRGPVKKLVDWLHE